MIDIFVAAWPVADLHTAATFSCQI